MSTKTMVGSDKLINVPYSIKCFFGENSCEKGDIDGWSILLAIIYFIIGWIKPHYYGTIIILSIVMECIQFYMNSQSKFIINPLIAITGYIIGSLLSPKPDFREKYKILLND